MSGGARNRFDGQRWIENIIKERTREALERFPARERYLHYNQEYKRQEELYKQERAERDRVRKERNEQRNQRRAEARTKNAAKAQTTNESETLLSENCERKRRCDGCQKVKVKSSFRAKAAGFAAMSGWMRKSLGGRSTRFRRAASSSPQTSTRVARGNLRTNIKSSSSCSGRNTPPKSRRKKKRRRKLPSSLRRKKLHNKLDAICLGTDLHIDWLHPPEADCRNPRFRAGNAEPGDLKTNLPGLRPSRNDESHRQLNSYSERAYCPGEVSRRNERTNGRITWSLLRWVGA